MISNEINLAVRDGATHFIFHLADGFLPTIGWLSRFMELLTGVVEKKMTIEVKANQPQIDSLKNCGLGLVADLVEK